MIDQVTTFIQPIILDLGALGVFLATLIEEVIAPIPSPLVPLTSGFFLLPADSGLIPTVWQSFITIGLPVACGLSIGALAVYGIGYWGGKPVLERSKKWLGFSWSDLEKTENKLIRGKSDEITLFVLRLLPIIPGVAISGFCGVIRYPLRTFLTITFLGSLTRATLLGLAGWYAGVMYTEYIDTIAKAERYLLVVIVALILIFIVRLTYKKLQGSSKVKQGNPEN